MIYQIIGLSLFALGFIHLFEPIRQLEYCFIKFLQERLGRKPYLAWFEELWVFGRTFFALTILIFLAAYSWKLGLTALAVFGVVAGLETVVKLTFNRERPFSVHKDVQMLQPREPGDPSFPSGDALRIWFLVLIFSIAFGNSLGFGVISFLLAVLVSLGRMILGVHFLTDVIAGTGLGILGAGTTIWLWQMLHLL
jgi:membrane-associated phospholipid phosphatase